MAKFLHKYGVISEAQEIEDLDLEKHCFLVGRTVKQGGLGRYGHLKNICKLVLPDLKWNPWLESIIETLCDGSIGRVNPIRREIVLAGCMAAGKTFGVGLFCFIWWICDPNNSIVWLTSTSAKMVRKRIWPVIQEFYREANKNESIPGNLLDSTTTLQARKGDDKHAIFAKAIGEGDPMSAANDIQGVHAPREIVVLDEATDVRRPILTAIHNLEGGCQELIVVYIGNAVSRFDPLGEAMEPDGGWDKITVESERWETKNGGYCLHFDGLKSPNVVAGKTLYPFIYTYENFIADQKKDQNSVEFWMYVRGFPAPDSVSNCVMSESLIEKHGATGVLTFRDKKRAVSGLDPGFEGDGCIQVFGEMGILAGDGPERIGVQITEVSRIEVSAVSREPRDFQIARQVVENCKTRGVAPECFGSDSTGTGRGVFAIIFEIWSSEIKRVEFGGGATDKPASQDDPRPGHLVYDRRVTELLYSVREFVVSRQLAGLTKPIIMQFSNRRVRQSNRMWSVETKKEYKKRHTHSPDEGDALAVMVEVARQLGATSMGTSAMRAQIRLQEIAEIAHDVYSPEDRTEDQGGMMGIEVRQIGQSSFNPWPSFYDDD